jgi:hypothetical protein
LVTFSGAITVSAGNVTNGIVPNGERRVDHIATSGRESIETEIISRLLG